MSQELCGWSFQNPGIFPSKITVHSFVGVVVLFLFYFRPKYFGDRFGSLLTYVEPNQCYNIILTIMLEEEVTIHKYLIWKKGHKGKELVAFAQGQCSHFYPKREILTIFILHPKIIFLD